MERRVQDLEPMPLVYPNMTARQLDEFLKQSKWTKYSGTVEVFKEPGRGRGVRSLKRVIIGDIVCWYSEDAFTSLQADKVYQINI